MDEQKQIEQLKRQIANKKHLKELEKLREGRCAFLLGQAAPVLFILLCVIPFLVTWCGGK